MGKNLNNHVSSEITDALVKFQDGYTKRDKNLIDHFMDELFDKNNTITIVGTSIGEWCIGYEEAKELFLSDWEYWGDLRINVDDASISSYEDTAWVYANGTLSYKFVRNEETFTRYLGYVREFFNEDGEHKGYSNKVKLTEINWMLCHLLHQRDTGEAKYLWDIGVSFVLVKHDSRWVIRQMQFSLPVVSHYPDVRIIDGNWCAGAYREEMDKLKTHSFKYSGGQEECVSKVLGNFNKDYLDMNKTPDELLKKYFSSSCPFVINTNMHAYKGTKSIGELIGYHRDAWDEILINSREALIRCSNNTAWVAANGITRKKITEEDAFNRAADAVKNIFDTNVPDKEKLFRIRRTIAGTVKENAVGEEYVWPFRFEGVLTNSNGQWLFEYIQFSYPFSYILEGKTDAAHVED